MTPDRFRDCLAALHWSQRGFADLLGADEARIRKMARGTRTIPDDLAAWLERRAAAMEADPPPVVIDGRRRVEETAQTVATD